MPAVGWQGRGKAAAVMTGQSYTSPVHLILPPSFKDVPTLYKQLPDFLVRDASHGHFPACVAACSTYSPKAHLVVQMSCNSDVVLQLPARTYDCRCLSFPSALFSV